MKRVATSVMTGLMIGGMVGAVSCSPRGGGDAQKSHSEMSGIYDDKYLLRLAEVQLPLHKRMATRPGSKGTPVLLENVPRTYRFEICDASGKGCVGAFENPEREDVLIEVTKLGSLDLDNNVEHNKLAKKIEQRFDLQIADLEAEIATISTPLALRRAAAPAVTMWALMTLGLAGGNEIIYPPEHKLEDTIDDKAAAMDSFNVLPKYLNMENGLLSTDPDNHVSVVGDPKADVKNIIQALAAHINNTAALNEDDPPEHSAAPVKYVCFMNRSSRDGKLCGEALY